MVSCCPCHPRVSAPSCMPARPVPCGSSALFGRAAVPRLSMCHCRIVHRHARMEPGRVDTTTTTAACMRLPFSREARACDALSHHHTVARPPWSPRVLAYPTNLRARFHRARENRARPGSGSLCRERKENAIPGRPAGALVKKKLTTTTRRTGQIDASIPTALMPRTYIGALLRCMYVYPYVPRTIACAGRSAPLGRGREGETAGIAPQLAPGPGPHHPVPLLQTQIVSTRDAGRRCS
jgi:hypothetical protein